MEEQREPLSRLEASISDALVFMSQRTSRRGTLATLGKVALALVGASVVYEALPVNRITAEAASCSDTDLCGICGKICDCCTGSPLNYCPSGSQWFSYWSGCCCTGWFHTGCTQYLYWDCCNCDCPSCCNCLWCSNNCNQPAWCNGGTYCCTAVVSNGGC